MEKMNKGNYQNTYGEERGRERKLTLARELEVGFLFANEEKGGFEMITSKSLRL
jgi:hypothetical protein